MESESGRACRPLPLATFAVAHLLIYQTHSGLGKSFRSVSLLFSFPPASASLSLGDKFRVTPTPRGRKRFGGFFDAVSGSMRNGAIYAFATGTGSSGFAAGLSNQPIER